MRSKLGLAVILTMAIAAPVTVANPAGATVAAPGDSKFCAAAKKFTRSLRDENPAVVEDLDELEDFWNRVLRSVKKLERLAPPELEGPFETLTNVYEQVVDDPGNATKYLLKRKIVRALAKFSQYSQEQCGIGTPSG